MKTDTIMSFLNGSAAVILSIIFVWILQVIKRTLIEYNKKINHS